MAIISSGENSMTNTANNSRMGDTNNLISQNNDIDLKNETEEEIK